MRLVLIILMLAGIALAMVHIRRAEVLAQHEVMGLQDQQIRLRRTLNDQQVHLSRLGAPLEVRQRAKEMGISLMLKGRGGEDMHAADTGRR